MRRFIRAGTAKTTLMELENENVAEKPPHRGSLTIYLTSVVAKELWAVKMFLRGVRPSRCDGAGNLSGLLRRSLVLSARL
jgi:hypothetical protein